MKKEILGISMCLPYATANQAGAKTAYYYFENIAAQEDFQLTLITKVLPSEKKYLGTLNTSINYGFVCNERKGIAEYLDLIKSLNSKLNPFYKYGNVLRKSVYDDIKKQLLELKNNGYRPSLILTIWTQMSLFIEELKSIFPGAPCVAIEEDVVFQMYQRKQIYEKNVIKQMYFSLQYKNMLKREVLAINSFDMVYVHSQKDWKLLTKAGVKSVIKIIPAYYNHTGIVRKPNGKDVLYWGSMSRPENYLSAIWFIKNVLPQLKDIDIRFVVLGGNPDSSLLKYRSNRIFITGFVDDPSPYFEEAVCLVAPLVLGAGVKVKILEAMDAGIPVLTNAVGIEGIDAVHNRDYFHCETPEEYINILKAIFDGKLDAQAVGDNAKCFMKKRYNFAAEMQKMIQNFRLLMK